MYQSIWYDNYKKKFHLWDDKNGYHVIPYRPYAYVKHSGGTHVSLYGDRLKKVFDFDKEDPNLFESDLPPTTRFLVDQYGKSDDVSEGHRLVFIDIEVEVTEGFPDVSKAQNAITAITIWDKITDSYFTYVLDPRKQIENYIKGNIEVELFSTEYEMLNKFFQKYMEIRPTIISGWNSDFFDVPYLYNRAVSVLGQSVAGLLSPISKVQWSDYKSQQR